MPEKALTSLFFVLQIFNRQTTGHRMVEATHAPATLEVTNEKNLRVKYTLKNHTGLSIAFFFPPNSSLVRSSLLNCKSFYASSTLQLKNSKEKRLNAHPNTINSKTIFNMIKIFHAKLIDIWLMNLHTEWAHMQMDYETWQM